MGVHTGSCMNQIHAANGHDIVIPQAITLKGVFGGKQHVYGPLITEIAAQQWMPHHFLMTTMITENTAIFWVQSWLYGFAVETPPLGPSVPLFFFSRWYTVKGRVEPQF